jgi:hypothetical protein
MSEFRQIIKDVLAEYSYDNDAQVINLASEVSQNLLSEAVEDRLKKKFHVFRINKIITRDCDTPRNRLGLGL